MIYFVNYKFSKASDSFMQERVSANNPDEALLIIEDRLAALAAKFELENHPYPPVKMSDVDNLCFTYCGSDPFAQG
jgi:hypothetical protein